MLTINVAMGTEAFDEANNRFVNSDYFTIELEHSLASLSKWESNYEKPFLSSEEKTTEETLFYIKECMLLTKNPPEDFLEKLSKSDHEAIQNYINAKQSATWFNDGGRPPVGTRPILTAEVIYGWMVALRIPFETEHWHLNRLFALIKVCDEQTKKPKKMGRSEAARQRAEINAQRKAQLGTRG